MKKYTLYPTLLALGLLNFTPYSTWADSPKPLVEKTYLEFNAVQCKNQEASSCYAEVYSNIEKNTQAIQVKSDSQNSGQDSIDRTVNGYSKIHLKKVKPEYVIVTMHGLWHSADQFSATLNRLSELVPNVQFNKIELTLPGHIKSKLDGSYEAYYNEVSKSGNKPSAKHTEWLEALDNTIKLAKQLGEKTIVVGHSTGGALAVNASLKYPDMVDNLILIEPALQVQNLNNLEACLSRYFPDQLFTYFADLFNVTLKPHKDLAMGCQVQKLADTFINRDLRVKDNQLTHYVPDDAMATEQDIPDDPEMPYTRENLKPYADVGSKIKVPVLLFNNQHDGVVLPNANLHFFSGLDQKISRYVLITEKIRHGVLTYSNPNFLAESIAQFMWPNK